MQDYLDDPNILSEWSGLLPDNCDIREPEFLTKVVLARRTGVTLTGSIHALQLLHLLEHGNPGSYQVALVLPEGPAFVASTPERLYQRIGRQVTSEAVAGVPAITDSTQPCYMVKINSAETIVRSSKK
jgi:menaquinone-specific isochorismate synthase